MTNGGTMNIIDSSVEKTGILYNSNGNSGSATITNKGTLNINSGTISGLYYAIKNVGAKTINVNTGSNIISEKYGIYNDSTSAPINLMNGSSITVTGSGDMAGIVSGSTTMENGSSIDVSSTSGSGSDAKVYGVRGGNLTMNGGSISVNSNSLPAYGSSAKATIKGSSVINVTGKNSTYGLSGTPTVEGGTITSTSTGGYAYGIYTESTATISGGEINAISTGSGTAYGYYHHGWVGTTAGNVTGGKITARAKNNSYGIVTGSSTGYGKPTINVSGGIIEASSEQGTSYGINNSKNNITGGTISGGTYGIYTTGTTTLGIDDGQLSSNNPEIIGGSYALYGGTINFYDGILKGQTSAYQDGIIDKIATDSLMHITTEAIDGDIYDVRYLVPEYNVAKIGQTNYTQLKYAITAANTGDVIELLADNYIFETITIPNDKDFIIETHDHIIASDKNITNNGKVQIINSAPTSSSPAFRHMGSGYFFTNNSGATLTLIDLKIEGTKIIDNKGTLFTDNLKINSSNVAINNDSTENTGVNTNLQITSSTYGLYNNNGELIADTFTLNGKAYVNAGKLNLKNGVINSAASVNTDLVATTQNGDIFLDNMQINMNEEYYADSSASSKYAYIINNAGTLALEHSSINYNLQGKTNVNTYAFYNSGTASLIDSHITFDPTNLTTNYSPYSARGIHNTSGTVGFESGSIYVPNKTAYGIYNETGSIILGIPEQPGPDYGRETADVSTTNPDIKAIGSSSGIGIKNASGGKVYFYDGRITGSSSAMPENPTATEYMFDPKDYLDENNYHYRILEWRREQPGN